MPTYDWNIVFDILDTLTEDEYSFTEIADYTGRQYGRDLIAASLRVLCERGLIALLHGATGEPRELQNDWESDIDDFFVIAQRDRESVASHFIQLTDAGKQVLGLFGIGHP